MDAAACALCLDAFDRALGSPTGCAFAAQFASDFPGCDPGLSIFRVRAMLAERRYATVAAYLADLDGTARACVRFLGPDHDLAVALWTIRQLIDDASAPVLRADDRAWRCALADLAGALRAFAPSIPDAREPYREWTKREPSEPPPPPPCRPAGPSAAHIDVYQLKAMIQRLPKDEDHHDLVRIVRRFEPEFASISGVVELDIKKCRPETLVRIHEFAVGRAPPAPPRPDGAVRRTGSSPALAPPKPLPSTVLFAAPVTRPLPESSPFLARLSSPPPAADQVHFAPVARQQQPLPAPMPRAVARAQTPTDAAAPAERAEADPGTAMTTEDKGVQTDECEGGHANFGDHHEIS
jgi:hypothetical protein